MSCTFSPDQLAQVASFHGHECPGLTIGIRAAELALQLLGHNDDADLVAVVETDMCGVDAIQFLTGCTMGKGNLVHRDHGKMAFTFFSRAQNKGFRALLNPDVRGQMDEEVGELTQRMIDGTATQEELNKCMAMRETLRQRFLDEPLETMFTVDHEPPAPPRRAAILQTLVCADCGENVMESRTRRFAGRTLCEPCFLKVEQKI